MTVLIATDLDRTLIYSRSAVDTYGGADRRLVAVERYLDADASWMTEVAALQLTELSAADDAVVVPVTTRTPEQWRRVALPGPPARYAITANGGILLVDGKPDVSWSGVVTAALAAVASPAEVLARAEAACDADWTLSLRLAADLFCYAVLDRTKLPDGFVTEVSAWAGELGWQVSLQGRKLYWVPRTLSKSAAVAEVVRRVGATSVLAAGDSLLDADLLLAADAGIVARHGELVATGWTAPSVGVTAAQGVLAGEEIVRWFATRAGSTPGALR